MAVDSKLRIFVQFQQDSIGWVKTAYHNETVNVCQIKTKDVSGLRVANKIKCVHQSFIIAPKDNSALETTGIHSKCFEHGGEKLWHLKQCYLKQTAAALGAGCYPVSKF